MKYDTLAEVKEFIGYVFEVQMPRDYYTSELELNEDEKNEIIELARELKEQLPKMVIGRDPFAK